MTTVGTPIKKIFDVLNREVAKRGIRLPSGVPLTVSGSLLRKFVETATHEHSSAIATDVASHLQHSVDTAKRHYVVESAEVARRHRRSLAIVKQGMETEAVVLQK